MIDEIGLQHLLIPMMHGGQNALKEGWQDPVFPDPGLWVTAVAATGAVNRDLTEAPHQKIVLTGPANADTARLYSLYRWTCGPTIWGSNLAYKRFIFAWEAKFDVVASIDNTHFLMGLAPTIAATRATNEQISFILTADALNTLTDDGGAETVTVVAPAPVLTNWHFYAIEVYAGGVVFYVDGVAVQHTTNLPDIAFYLTWYLPQEAAANGGELHVGALGAYYEFVVR